MPSAESPQKIRLGRIPSLHPIRSQQFWIEKDHLIIVSQAGLFLSFGQNFKHLFFKDIQGIQISKTRTGEISSAALVLLCLVCSLFAVLAFQSEGEWENGWGWFWCVLAFFWAVPAAWTLLLGATCRMCIKTAVQDLELNGVNRMRHAVRLFQVLEPLILEAQEALDTAVPPSFPPSDPPQAKAPGPLIPPPLKSFSLLPHKISAWCYLFLGFVTAWELSTTQVWPLFLMLGAGVIQAIFAIVVFIRNYGGKPGALKFLGQLTLSFVILNVLAAYVIYFKGIIQDPAQARNSWLNFQRIAGITMETSRYEFLFFTMDAGFCFLLALVYLWILRRAALPTNPIVRTQARQP